MLLSETIRREILAAQKEMTDEGKRRLGVLRMLSAAIKNEEIAFKAREKGLTDEQVVAVVRREVKKRKDAVTLYRGHGKETRALAEEAEAALLGQFLPVAPDAAVAKRTVEEIIAALPEDDRKNMGKIMKEVMAHFKGSADGAQVRALVQEIISAH